jgi:hypothetical protein
VGIGSAVSVVLVLVEGVVGLVVGAVVVGWVP